MKVTLPILQRVYESMQGEGQRDEHGQKDQLDPDSHLFFVNAFDMPGWHWSVERSTFEKYVHHFYPLGTALIPKQNLGYPDFCGVCRVKSHCWSRSAIHYSANSDEERTLLAVHTALERPGTSVNGTATMCIYQRMQSHALQLRTTKQLLGRANERFLLFGMLAHSKEGKLCLEDQDGSVELDFTQLVSLPPASVGVR
jgi:DNA polymerase epsilon subunit 2